MGIRESLLNTITPVGNSDFVRIVTSAGASNKAKVSALAKTTLEEYSDTLIAGAKQSVKSAIDTLTERLSAVEGEAAEEISSAKGRLLAVEGEVDVLDARITSLATLTDGSTTGDAELIDGRAGADGVTYTNIGGAIRGQITDLKSDLDTAKLVFSDEVFSVGDSIVQTSQAPNYKITADGVINDNTRITKVYPIGSEPIYIKSQDGIQYRSGISASTRIKTDLGAFDGWVYPYVGANYVAISYETDAVTYGAWKANALVSDVVEQSQKNEDAIADGGYFFEVSGTSASTSIYKDHDITLQRGDCVIVNLYSMTGATWSDIEFYGFDSQNQSTRLFKVTALGSYLVKINADYVKVRVRVPVTSPTTPKLVYGIYASTDLLSLSGNMALLRGKVSDIESANVLKGASINCLGDSFTDDSTSYAHVLSDRISDLTTILVARGNSAIVTDADNAPSFLSRIDGTAPKEGGGYYTGLSTSADITVIFGGINDCRDLGSGAITMGNIDSTHDASTFYGGMQLLLDRIIAMCTNQFMLGVIPPSFQPNAPYTTYIGQVQEAEREIYRKYHIPYVDLAYDCYAMSDNADVMALYRKSVVAPTNYHPNADGAKKICDLIQGKLETMYRYDV